MVEEGEETMQRATEIVSQTGAEREMENPVTIGTADGGLKVEIHPSAQMQKISGEPPELHKPSSPVEEAIENMSLEMDQLKFKIDSRAAYGHSLTLNAVEVSYVLQICGVKLQKDSGSPNVILSQDKTLDAADSELVARLERADYHAIGMVLDPHRSSTDSCTFERNGNNTPIPNQDIKQLDRIYG
jgi:hypothetical protein